MTRPSFVACLHVAALAAAGCTTTGRVSPGQDGPPSPARCEEVGAPPGCGQGCTSDILCGPGLHCVGGACTAECWAERPCASGLACDGRGRCVDPSALLDGGAPDAALPDGGQCAAIAVALDAVVPNVTFILDRSGSMLGGFRDTGVDRWDVLRESLFREPAAGDPTDRGGIVRELHERVRFGLALYTYDQDEPENACPVLVEEPILLSNYAAMRDAFDANPPPNDGDTPTGDSIDAVRERLDPGLEDPRIFVVATDGDPDRCENPNDHGSVSEDLSVAAVTRAYAAGIETFMISLGPVGQRHMQDMANAGQGLPVKPRGTGGYVEGTDPMAKWYEPADDEGLRTALSEIVRGALSCELEVEGRLDPTRACEGTLLVDGAPVACDAPGSGWRALDERRLELLGALCEDLLAGRVETLEGSFPCDVVLE